ncbi:hypothetical protein JCM11641_000047 [Rhodosporidiobolus odoratus]
MISSLLPTAGLAPYRRTCHACGASRWLSTDSPSSPSHPPTSAATSASPSTAQPPPAKRPQPSWVRSPGPPHAPSPISPPRRTVGALEKIRTAWNKQSHTPYREPPNVAKARKKTVGQRNVFESYLVLPWNVRLYFWLALGAFAAIGMYVGDELVPAAEDEGEDGHKV